MDMETAVRKFDGIWPFETMWRVMYWNAFTEVYVTSPSAGPDEDPYYTDKICTRTEFDQCTARLRNEPSFGDHPDARCFVQDAHGVWFKNTSTSVVRPMETGWYSVVQGWWSTVGKGEVLGDWKDTLRIRPEEKPTMDSVKEPKYQYFYKRDDCKSMTGTAPDCICWNDEGTGPMKDATHDPNTMMLQWRMRIAGGNEVEEDRLAGVEKEAALRVNEPHNAPEKEMKTIEVECRGKNSGHLCDTCRRTDSCFSVTSSSDINVTECVLYESESEGGSDWYERGEFPPVGTACEMRRVGRDFIGGVFRPGTVMYRSDRHIVWRFNDGNEIGLIPSYCEFRPPQPKTEREMLIKKATDVVKDARTPGNAVSLLDKAGMLKMPEEKPE